MQTTIDVYSQRTAPACPHLVYDSIPTECRRQILYIAEYFFGLNGMKEFAESKVWPMINATLRHEHGKERLVDRTTTYGMGNRNTSSWQVKHYFMHLDDVAKVLDVVEVLFATITRLPEMDLGIPFPFHHYPPANAVADLNKRLSQHCLGYRFEDNMILRIDNDVMYQTVTRETMVFLANPDYHNIDEEYRQALKHFRAGDYKDCIVNAAKAFESTMKVICHKMGYPYSQNDTAKPLLDILYNNQFVPTYLQQQLTALRTVLGDGVSVVRNKTSGHGAGAAVIEVNEELAAYGLNTAGANIKFLLSLLEKQQPTH